MYYSLKRTFGNHIVSLETGKIARQTDGSVLLRYGDAVILATVVSERNISEEVSFFPLMVDYREKTYAAGKIPGGFIKREGKSSTKEVLSSRLIDRPLRPLFPEGYMYQTQIICSVLSADQEIDTDVLAITAASAALNISDIPFKEVISGIRIGKKDGRFIVNPTFEEREKGNFDLVVAASKTAIVMVEGSTNEVQESEIVEALKFAFKEIQKLISLQEELIELKSPVKREYKTITPDKGLLDQFNADFKDDLEKALLVQGKLNKINACSEVYKCIEEKYADFLEEKGISKNVYKLTLDEFNKKVIRAFLKKNQYRIDLRKFNEVRPINIEVGLLPRTHGSSIFTRGETQALGSITLGSPSDQQIIDALEGESKQKFMLHYNFASFCVGEVGFLRAPGRREIGHGNLALRAITPVIPSSDNFPYTIRIVSEILESNGSSSMATVCAASLACMDAGIPISKQVAGVAMGLIKEEEDFIILTDILGSEDHIGDMDFKVAGTNDGITAIQMDIKIDGLAFEIIENALAEAKQARLHILSKMNEVIDKPQVKLSEFAPRILKFKVKPSKIKDIIGPGGKIIKSIIERTNVTIDIEDDGTVCVAGVNRVNTDEAKNIILGLTEDPEIGKVYLGTVKRIEKYGAFVEILPGKEGLVHVSQIASYHVKDIRDELNEGDKVLVKLTEIDRQNRIKLSRKAAMNSKNTTK